MATPTPVTISPFAFTDGIQYSNAVLLGANEVDLYNGAAPQDPGGISCNNGLYLFASIHAVVAGTPGSGNAWIAIQTALADNIWYDLAWLELAFSVGNGTYNRAFGSNSTATNNWISARAAGTDPGATGVNGIPLGGQFRFTGKSTYNQGSCTVSIYYKLQGLR